MTIAFLGTGLMGTGFVQRLRANGQEVRVWNRSAEKARRLEAQGARAFEHAAEAVAGVARIHLSLADDASVDAVLEPLADGLPAGSWIVDHTTTAVAPTAARSARWEARGHHFVHAPVFMGPANCAAGTGLMLLACTAARRDALLPSLQQMTGTVSYLGEDPSRAAAFKLFGNLTLLGFIGVLADVNRLAHAMGIGTADAFSLFQHFNPGATLPQRAERIVSADVTQPSFELAMARKDLRLMMEDAARGGMDLVVTPAIARLFDEAIARGQGHLDTVIAARIPNP